MLKVWIMDFFIVPINIKFLKLHQNQFDAILLGKFFFNYIFLEPEIAGLSWNPVVLFKSNNIDNSAVTLILTLFVIVFYYFKCFYFEITKSYR